MTTQTLVIDRRSWARFTHADRRYAPALYDPKRGYCCLGFYCKQFHSSPDYELVNQYSPSRLGIDTLADIPYVTLGGDTLEDALINANDGTNGGGMKTEDVEMTDAEQEQEIARLFGLAGITVEFVG